MLRQLRNSPRVRAALLAAGLFAVLASFGLHPEPFGADHLAAHRGLASAHTDEAPHLCPACLTHGAVLVARPATLLIARLASTPETFPAEADPIGPLAGRDLSGRSPPAGS